MISAGPWIRLDITDFLLHVREVDQRNGNHFLSFITAILVLSYVINYFMVTSYYENTQDYVLMLLNATYFFFFILLYVWGEWFATRITRNTQLHITREREKED